MAMVGTMKIGQTRTPDICRGFAMEGPTVSLFSYGTLQLAQVQLEKYGRVLDGKADALPGYRLEQLEVNDPEVIRLSGKSEHPIARYSGQASDRVAGIVYEISESELAATDDYEVEPYDRVEVDLESGRRAFAYLLVD
jgi:gamma-glutamylcyclotransferase (GGCT)/AIG2-like uncharacterized protein YtfP